MEPNSLSRVERYPDIKVTKRDLGRLNHMLNQHATTWSWKAVRFLEQELTRATVVEEKEVPAQVVTMRSRVVFREGESEVYQVATLSYPGEGEIYDDALSVLTPAGAALLGLSEGQSISYPAPEGRWKTFTVQQVLSQRE